MEGMVTRKATCAKGAPEDYTQAQKFPVVQGVDYLGDALRGGPASEGALR